MGEGAGHRYEPFSANRRMAAASAGAGRKANTIHLVTEADVTDVRRLMAQHRERTGEPLSLTAYVVTCLAHTLSEFPRFNSFRKGRRLVVLEDATISVLYEREIAGESVPEPVGIPMANRKTYREVNDELRAAQLHSGERLGASSRTEWVRFIPGVFLRAFIRLASRSVRMAKRFGVVGVTAIGMFGSGPTWLVPLTSATVTVAVGSLVRRVVVVDGEVRERDHLCLTVSFNHDIVDGAPATRFVARLVEQLASADDLRPGVAPQPVHVEQGIEQKARM
ncbi:MAG: 2-oxo acid dehydrogenase subunit E2 [Coriobacteriales bacterium]|nr:2-oxo acid dehydrogenase subunit E2 [Coriobacteriales bacterium]